MKKKLLLSLLIVVTNACAQIEYRYERDLITMFEDPTNYSFEEKCAMTNHSLKWLKQLIDDNATGRHILTLEDEKYIERISWMICSLYRETQYMGQTHKI